MQHFQKSPSSVILASSMVIRLISAERRLLVNSASAGVWGGVLNWRRWGRFEDLGENGVHLVQLSGELKLDIVVANISILHHVACGFHVRFFDIFF